MSQTTAKKVMIIGYDAPITKSLLKYMKEGVMPNLARLVKQGVWADHCLVPHPTITPPNWTTIVTGAWPGTHGITCFNAHRPGDPLLEAHQAFLTEDCQAEYFWNAAAKQGKNAILLNYPSTYPRAIKKGVQVAGAGLSVNEWRTPEVAGAFAIHCSLSADLLFATEEFPIAEKLELKPAEGWRHLPKHQAAREAELQIEARWPKAPVKPQTWYLCLLKSKGRFDRAVVATGRDGRKALATLRVGEWSPKIVHSFKVGGRNKQAVFRLKLLELSRDGKRVKLYCTALCQLDGWATPGSVCRELKEADGLPIPSTYHGAHENGWIDDDTYFELMDMQHRWYGDAAVRLMKKHPWDIFCMHAHTPDHCYHHFVNDLDPGVCKDAARRRSYQRLERDCYQSLDRMLGRVLKAADEQTVVVVTSDHGAVPTEEAFKPNRQWVDVHDILEKAGLMVFKKKRVGGEREIDWSKTRAVAQRSVYVYVNLKGRDPQGIVKPGKEYEEVVERVIRALYDYTEPRSGKKPFVFALRKADARILGLRGDKVGDVVFGVHGWVAGEHGRQVPTADYGIGSMRGVFVMAGPGVKKGLRLERTVWLTDIVPTVCYLTGFPVPRDAEGAVVYQALKDRDHPQQQAALLRRNLERLQRSVKSEKMLTHRY